MIKVKAYTFVLRTEVRLRPSGEIISTERVPRYVYVSYEDKRVVPQPKCEDWAIFLINSS